MARSWLGVPLILFLSLTLWTVLVWGLTLALSQPPGDAPACETIASDQYQKLLADQLVPAGQAGQPLIPAQQVVIIASQLRVQRTQYDIKEQQAKMAETNVAQLLEQLRQRTLDVQTLQAEVEKLKNGAAAPTK